MRSQGEEAPFPLRVRQAWPSPPGLLQGDWDAESVGEEAGEPAMEEEEEGDYSESEDSEEIMLDEEQEEAEMK